MQGDFTAKRVAGGTTFVTRWGQSLRSNVMAHFDSAKEVGQVLFGSWSVGRKNELEFFAQTC